MILKSERGSWLRGQCYACGHRLRFDSTGCPQCGEEFHGLKVKVRDVCQCDRCDPIKAKYDLGLLCMHLIGLLRDARRFRRAERAQVKRLLELTIFSQTAQPNILREQCEEIRRLAQAMHEGPRVPSSADVSGYRQKLHKALAPVVSLAERVAKLEAK